MGSRGAGKLKIIVRCAESGYDGIGMGVLALGVIVGQIRRTASWDRARINDNDAEYTFFGW